MKRYDDDDLERALFALDLEEPPAGLRESILAGTVHAAGLPAAARPWEAWFSGCLLALLTWMLASVLHGTAHGFLTQGVSYAVEAFALIAQPATLFWLAVGGAATVWFSQLNLTATPGYERAVRR